MIEVYKTEAMITTQRCLIIFRTGEYRIGHISVPLIKQSDGHFKACYPDNYKNGDGVFYFLRVEREKNTLVYKEGK